MLLFRFYYARGLGEVIIVLWCRGFYFGSKALGDQGKVRKQATSVFVFRLTIQKCQSQLRFVNTRAHKTADMILQSSAKSGPES